MIKTFNLFYTKSLKSSVYFKSPVHLNIDSKFSLDMIDLYLDFRTFVV